MSRSNAGFRIHVAHVLTDRTLDVKKTVWGKLKDSPSTMCFGDCDISAVETSLCRRCCATSDDRVVVARSDIFRKRLGAPIHNNLQVHGTVTLYDALDPKTTQKSTSKKCFQKYCTQSYNETADQGDENLRLVCSDTHHGSFSCQCIVQRLDGHWQYCSEAIA